MDVYAFFVALGTDLISLLSGIGSVVLLFIGLIKGDKPVPRRVIFMVAGACFFFASARVWTTEHRANISANHRADDARKKLDDVTKPQFVVDVYFTLSGDVAYKGTVLFMNLGVRNLGAPSAVYAWRLSVKSQTTTVNDLTPTEIGDGYKMRRGEDGSVIAEFHKNNRIEEKHWSL